MRWPVKVPRPVGTVRPAGEPTFSVVIAAYQAEATIGEAIESALTQTRPPLEVVVCDDGSSDATAEVAGRFAGVRLVRQANRGEGAAKNAAVRAARGQYVVVLDADDVFMPERLESLGWLAAQRPDLDVLTTDAVLEADGVPMRSAYHAGWTFPVADQRAAILDRNFVFGLAAVRRQRWLEVGGFDEDLTQTTDWEFWQRLILSGSGVGLVDVPLARYRLTTGTLSSDRTKMVRARITVLQRAARRTDLTEGERRIVAAAIARERRTLVLRLAREAVGSGARDARRRAAAVVVHRRVDPRSRLGALVGLVSPSLLARRRAAREDGMVEIGAGLRVPAREDG